MIDHKSQDNKSVKHKLSRKMGGRSASNRSAAHFLKPISTFRTKLKILCRLISAVAAAPVSISTASLIHQSQVLRQNLHLLPARNGLAHFRIQLIQGIAAAHPHVIMPVPFEAWNEEQRQYRICHEYLIPPILSAHSADHGLRKIKLLSSICNSYHKKHKITLSFLIMM